MSKPRGSPRGGVLVDSALRRQSKSKPVLSAAKAVAAPVRAVRRVSAGIVVSGSHHKKHQYKLIYALRTAAVFQHKYYQEQSENVVLHNSSVKNVYARRRHSVRNLSRRRFAAFRAAALCRFFAPRQNDFALRQYRTGCAQCRQKHGLTNACLYGILRI